MSLLNEMYHAFLKRETQYKSATDEIWSSIPFVVEGVSKYLKVPANLISWNSADVIGQELIILVSVKNDDRFQYTPPGTIAARMLTIILPISVVETSSAKSISLYLKETQDIRSQDTHPDIERGGVVAYQHVTRRTLH